MQWGRPFGGPLWQKQIAKRLGLESAYRPIGRPLIDDFLKSETAEEIAIYNHHS